jgi:hypothetical protein
MNNQRYNTLNYGTFHHYNYLVYLQLMGLDLISLAYKALN